MSNNDLSNRRDKGRSQYDFSKLNDNYRTYREKYTKQDLGIQVEFIGDSRRIIKGKNKSVYFPGEDIKGNITISENLLAGKPSSTEISLKGIEYAYAEGHDTISEVKEFQLQIIPLDFKMLKSKAQTSKHISSYNDINKTIQSINRIIIPFYGKIPYDVTKSYVGKYSEHFWGFDVKIDIPFSKDIHAKAIIDLV